MKIDWSSWRKIWTHYNNINSWKNQMWWKQSTNWRDLKEPREEASARFKWLLSISRKTWFEWQVKYSKAKGSLKDHMKACNRNSRAPYSSRRIRWSWCSKDHLDACRVCWRKLTSLHWLQKANIKKSWRSQRIK